MPCHAMPMHLARRARSFILKSGLGVAASLKKAEAALMV